MASPEHGPVFVLIHSPLVGPTTWSPLADELERRGREAVVPSLLGVADAPSPQWRHAPEAVRAATAGAGSPAVLVGHGGGGLLLPVIADALPGEVDALVFVDSFLPPAGGSLPLAGSGLMDQLRALASDGVLPPWSSWFDEGAMRELVPDAARAGGAPRPGVRRVRESDGAEHGDRDGTPPVGRCATCSHCRRQHADARLPHPRGLDELRLACG
jgi:pimeloyl-ACP methyl ester carboxylesterase